VSIPVNKTVLGGFVVGAIALFVAAILVFGSGQFFKESILRVMYFDGSVKGLNVGAPVLFRGVKIGSIKEISLHWDLQKKEVEIPVVAEIEPEAFKFVGGIRGGIDPVKSHHEMVERGLRAQLDMQSIVTGQLLVTIDFHPGTPVNLHKDAPHLEIPTIPTTLQQITKTLQELPLEEMVSKLTSAIESFEKVVSSPDLKDSVVNLNLLLKDARKLVQNVDGQVEPLVSSMKDTMGDTRRLLRDTNERIASVGSSAEQTLADTRNLINNVNSRVEPIQGQLSNALQSAGDAIKRVEETLGEIEKTTKSDSLLMYRLTRTLEEFENLARSIRVLADYLERHPEALLKGKGRPGGK